MKGTWLRTCTTSTDLARVGRAAYTYADPPSAPLPSSGVPTPHCIAIVLTMASQSQPVAGAAVVRAYTHPQNLPRVPRLSKCTPPCTSETMPRIIMPAGGMDRCKHQYLSKRIISHLPRWTYSWECIRPPARVEWIPLPAAIHVQLRVSRCRHGRHLLHTGYRNDHASEGGGALSELEVG